MAFMKGSAKMYLPDHFRETDLAEIRLIAERYPLATCVAHARDEFELYHLPMIWRDDVLIGHIALANQMHTKLENGCKAAFVFCAEDSYVSPNWYPTKAEHQKHVPTWNYQVVHLHGELFFSHNTKDKIAAVGVLTKLHEERVNGAGAWKMRDAPKDFMEAMLDNIVAIEFKIRRIDAKSKLSQNRQEIDYSAVIEKMREHDLTGITARMQKIASD